ncbi:methionyl-tRNA formyltransferase [Sediminispirochaeta smaragdinae]|uniref:Methionyl-tRNA formyltransferase n=1 Tax=Sediminispirochaeta smaragdinae (strain DSM 11293 / JCM 15392 / SEBR 4228) TaxID=573413 RepID=E1R617_SEDSS|nr:methionyl-tRNA formyltransferase [Sediminispirochaeta smaragdinae]ADK80782.1 methionyl-tRNA formyltransferase [Sediminispirochaeta smaragdinae DSM 11293]
MRVLFAGTPEIAVPSLKALLFSNHQLCGVLTNPDRPRGRGRAPSPSPVKQALLDSGKPIPLLQFEHLKGEAREAVAALKPDVLAVFAFGRIFGPKFLALFSQGGINVHPSLLPRHRGPSPIPAAILSGDEKSGITIQRLAREMDKGAVLSRLVRDLNGRETTASLSAWAAEEGARLLVSTLDALERGELTEEEQDEVFASYSEKIDADDSLIDWNLPAVQIDRMVRAFNPWPRTRTSLEGKELLILDSCPLPAEKSPSAPGTIAGVDRKRGILVQTGDGLLAVVRLQLKTKKPLDFASFYNGNRDIAGKRLGGQE